MLKRLIEFFMFHNKNQFIRAKLARTTNSQKYLDALVSDESEWVKREIIRRGNTKHLERLVYDSSYLKYFRYFMTHSLVPYTLPCQKYLV